MKKIILFLLFITGAVNAQIVNIPDANFKAMLLAADVTNSIASTATNATIPNTFDKIDTNNDGEIQVSEAASVTSLNVSNSNISDLTGIEAFVSLHFLKCQNNQITNLDVNNFSFLVWLDCQNNFITQLDISNLITLQNISCDNNQITNLNLSNLPSLYDLYCGNNQVTSLNLSGAPHLAQLGCGNNHLPTLDVSGLVNLEIIECQSNQLTTLNIDGLTKIDYLDCSNNLLTNLDTSSSSLQDADYFNCSNNQLIWLNIKNGKMITIVANQPPATTNFNIIDNPNLKYICADDTEIDNLLQFTVNNSMFGVNINTYCSFTPNGNYNTITGTQLFDTDNNGCDANDLAQQFVKININDGPNQDATFTNAEGNYKFYTQAGTFTVAPELENPSFFNVNPNNAVVNFPDVNNNISTQNFCLAANGIHQDIEVAITPITPARPGFDAIYKVVYKNKGNKTMTQQYGISFSYNQNLMSFVSANPVTTTQNAGTMNWDYTNLLPFESRSILITMHVNAPTDTNPVNINDVLNLTAIISPQNLDENVADNIFIFHQTAVGSYDPNNIACIEGGTVAPSEIGKYLHYAINFENTGTAPAENIVVKVVIDDTKFDVSSLQILNGSHPVYIRVKGNIAEFIFENIQLNTNGHGNILLKIKTKDNLAAGDMVAKKADIFFDYNFPIATNIASTVFQSLGIGDFEKDNSVSIYPNPSNGIVNIKADNTIQSIALYDVQGRVLVTRLIKDVQSNLDISNYSGGVYFIKVFTDKGMKLEKIMKN